MRTILISVLALAAFQSAAQEDPAALIEKLKSTDAGEVRRAGDRLVRLGADAVATLKGAVAGSTDPDFKRLLAGLLERIEVRLAAPRLAKRWGDRWYAMVSGGRAVGWLHATTQEKEGRLILVDEFVTESVKDRRQTITSTLTALADDYLTPVELSISLKTSERTCAARLEVKNGRAKVLENTYTDSAEEGAGAEVLLKPNTITDFAVMRLATLLPRTEGYAVTLLVTIGKRPDIADDAVVVFDADEEVSVGGTAVKARRFRLKQRDLHDIVYWADADGRLVKMEMLGKVDLVLADEQTAKRLQPVEATPKAAVDRAGKPRDADGTLPVFPGAEGFGTKTRAGRGGKVIEVTSLADSGRGTLREALNDPSPRIIVFRVGGTIELESELFVANPFVTVAGQTAPGDGICIKNAGVTVTSHDVLIQHLRVRPGSEGKVNPENNDAISILGTHGKIKEGAYNVVLDHVSASWSEDEAVSTWFGPTDITFSWCIVSEALDKSRHPKGHHSAGLLVGDASHRVSVHHCLMAHNGFRNPLVSRSGTVDVVNNVVYDWGNLAGEITDPDRTVTVNFVGNVWKAGPSTQEGAFEIIVDDAGKLFLKDNAGPHRGRGDGEFALTSLGWGGAKRVPDECRAAGPFEAARVTVLPTADVLEKVLAGAGALAPKRDAVDARVVTDVKKGTGSIIDSPAQVGGHPKLASGPAPEDSDHDGMPDDWEKAHGLDPRDPSDGKADRDGDGYTNVEEYFHSLLGK